MIWPPSDKISNNFQQPKFSLANDTVSLLIHLSLFEGLVFEYGVFWSLFSPILWYHVISRGFNIRVFRKFRQSNPSESNDTQISVREKMLFASYALKLGPATLDDNQA